MVKAWLGMGGNMGDVCDSLNQALTALADTSNIELIAVSSFYQTPPWGKVEQNDFVNLCCVIDTDLPPEDLLQHCLLIEKKLGRIRNEKWGPRKLDIDVLLYEGVENYKSEDLILPHPFMLVRSFVLIPLAEIAKNLMVAGMSVGEWAQKKMDKDIKILANKPIFYKYL